MPCQVTPPDVAQRWAALWRDAGAASPPPGELDALLGRYHEPHRHYHDLVHIGECLVLLDVHRSSARVPALVGICLWYHDAVYDPRGSDNEALSADLCTSAIAAAGAAIDPAEARRLILATRHSGAAPDATADEALLLDIDLAILGADPERFAAYDAAIRREYDWVPEPLYRAKRAQILRSFLQREAIYATPAISAERESRARRNLSDAIRRLHG